MGNFLAFCTLPLCSSSVQCTVPLCSSSVQCTVPLCSSSLQCLSLQCSSTYTIPLHKLQPNHTMTVQVQRVEVDKLLKVVLWEISIELFLNKRVQKSSKATYGSKIPTRYWESREMCVGTQGGRIVACEVSHIFPGLLARPPTSGPHHDTVQLHPCGGGYTCGWAVLAPAFNTCPNDPTMGSFILGGRRIFLLHICPEMMKVLQCFATFAGSCWIHDDIGRIQMSKGLRFTFAFCQEPSKAITHIVNDLMSFPFGGGR